MLSSTDQIYTDRKEWDKIRADKIRELAQQYSISGDGEPIYGSLMPDDNKNYSSYVDFKLEQTANKYKE